MKKTVQSKSNQSENRYVRLFFALWPDEVLQESLHAMAVRQQKQCKGRVMRVETLHLTLLFLGDTPFERLPELLAAASKVRTGPFDLELDRIAYWKHNGIAYMAPSRPPQALFGLFEQLSRCVTGADFRFDGKSFVPHITLLRNVISPPVAEAGRLAPSIWHVRFLPDAIRSGCARCEI